MAQFQVSAGASRILLGAVRTAQGLNLVVEGLECGINLHVVLPEGAGGLIGSHVPERIRGLLCLTETSKGRQVDARAWRTGRARRTCVTRRTLKEGRKNGVISGAIRCGKTELKKQKCCVLQVQLLQNAHEVQVVQWVQAVHLSHLCQQVQLIRLVPTERVTFKAKAGGCQRAHLTCAFYLNCRVTFQIHQAVCRRTKILIK